MPITGLPIEPKDDEEFKDPDAKIKGCKTAEEIGSTAGYFVSS
jgi:hypothetical protein